MRNMIGKNNAVKIKNTKKGLYFFIICLSFFSLPIKHKAPKAPARPPDMYLKSNMTISNLLINFPPKQKKSNQPFSKLIAL